VAIGGVRCSAWAGALEEPGKGEGVLVGESRLERLVEGSDARPAGKCS